MSHRGSAAILLAFAVACSSLEPRSGITLRVVNSSCQSGPCDSLRVLAFPGNQPGTPGGYWSVDLGVITGRYGCVTIPPEARFYLIFVNPLGGADTSVTTRTPAMSMALGGPPPSFPFVLAWRISSCRGPAAR